MKKIIRIIKDRRGALKIRFSVFVYGSIVTTRFTFPNLNFTQEDLTRAVNETQKASGTTDLQQALEEAEILCNLTSTPNTTKAFIVLDSASGSAYKVWKIKYLFWNRVRIWRNRLHTSIHFVADFRPGKVVHHTLDINFLLLRIEFHVQGAIGKFVCWSFWWKATCQLLLLQASRCAKRLKWK